MSSVNYMSCVSYMSYLSYMSIFMNRLKLLEIARICFKYIFCFQNFSKKSREYTRMENPSYPIA